MRYRVLDGFRGFFLIFMVVVHANETLKAILGKLNHHYFGWVEDAQGFVFLSGLVVGLVYGGILDRKGVPALWAAVRKRCFEIYKCQAGLILLFALGAMTLFTQASVLQPYVQEPAWFTLAALALVSTTQDMGILPMYIYFFFTAPFALIAIKKGLIAPVVFASLGLWLFGQTSLFEAGTDALSATLAAHGVHLTFSLFFNVFAWQVLFAFGLFLGYRLSQGRLSLEWLKDRQWGPAFYIAAATIFLLGVFDRVVFNTLISQDFSDAFLAREHRKLFSEFHLFAFALDLFAITWLLVAGPASQFKVTRAASKALHTVFNHKALVFLGQHSLQVFAFHMVVVYAMRIGFEDRAPAQWLANVILVLCVLSLYIPAWLHAGSQARAKAVAAKSVGAQAN